MRYNKQELIALALQPSNKFDKEGLLFITEKQEGFFRKHEAGRTSLNQSSISLFFGGTALRRSNSLSSNCSNPTHCPTVNQPPATPNTEREENENACEIRMRNTNKRTSSYRRKSFNCIGGSLRRRKVNAERWCRLRGNLLFYFKTEDQFSDLQGVVVLEKCHAILEQDDNSRHSDEFGFIIEFEDGLRQRFGTKTMAERSSWMQAITMASYGEMRRTLQILREKLDMRRGGAIHDVDVDMLRLQTGITVDINEVPICETALSCDNLLCDGHGRPPSPSIQILVTINGASTNWIKYGRTEVVEHCSNPQFINTVLFRTGDGLTASSQVRFVVYDVREKMSQTAVPIGSAEISLNAIKDTTRLRLPLHSPASNVGFITISSWSPIQEKKMTARSPSRTVQHQVTIGHRRSQSLPPKLGAKLFVPSQQKISQVFVNPNIRTYRLQSGLGGEISVHEMMLETQLCFLIPQQLLAIWILREKELLQEISGMGELGGDWRNKQMDLLDKHLKLLKNYSQAKQNMQKYGQNNAICFKPSTRKGDEALEFAPVNMHLQRMWAHNETLKRSGCLDVVTVGAFTRHNGKSKTGGLIKMLQQLKSSATASEDNDGCKVEIANGAVQAIKQLRKEIVEIMSQLLALAKTKNPKGMLNLCTEMVAKTRSLLMIWEPHLVDEAFAFIERHRIVEDSTCQPVSDLSSISPFKKITQQLGALDLKSPELEDFATPLGPAPDLWPKRSRSPRNSMNVGSDIKSKSPSATDLTSLTTVTLRNYQLRPDAGNSNQTQSLPPMPVEETHFDVNGDVFTSGVGVEPQASVSAMQDFPADEDETYLGGASNAGGFLDTKMMSTSPAANYYRPTEEPEPLDLTQLNIEASVMCLVSKVKFLCGRCGSPAVRLRQPGKGFVTPPDVVTNQSGKSAANDTEMGKKPRELNLALRPAFGEVVDGQIVAPKKTGNKFTDGLDLSMTADWSSELRPSMRKLRQAMDGLLKTARLMHSVQRLQQDTKKMNATLSVMYRRDICFSSALTALITGLMAKLWGTDVDVNYINLLYNLGPLAYFEGLLSLYGAETDMWGDHCVAIEDLSAVTFKLCRNTSNMLNNDNVLPVPKIIGSRQSLTVLLPVPANVQNLLPTKEAIVFKVTPVFFNIGINEKATISETLRFTTEQTRSNWDNFDRLRQYHLKYRKLIFVPPDTPSHKTVDSVDHVSSLLTSMEEQLKANVSKNVRVLQLGEDICRAISGIAFISCKSAKDRTAMAVTLQQCRILQTEFHLPASKLQTVLNTMRSEGTRIENASKNIGIKKYAFNLPQVLSLPQQYRPPTGSYGKAQT